MNGLPIMKQVKNRFSSILLMLVFMIIGVTQFVFYNQDMRSHSQELQEIKKMETDVAWSLISSVFDTVQRAANEKADRTAISIVNSIRSQYPDLSALKVKLDQRKLEDTKLPHIIYDNLYGQQMFDISNGNNDSFVLLRDGYVLDSDINRFGKSWHTFAEESDINIKELYSILENSNRINDGTVICSYPSGDDCDTVITERITKAQLKEVFAKDGLIGLKKYTFFGKAYITDNGDIFETPDVSYDSRKNLNHKMIVIQKFNMYDIMNYHHGKDIELNKLTFKSLSDNLERDTLFHNIGYLGLFGMDIVAMLIVFFTAFKKKERENDVDE